MKYCEREITEDEAKKAEEKGVYSLFHPAILMGYGVYDADIVSRDGKKILRYSMGSSCD